MWGQCITKYDPSLAISTIILLAPKLFPVAYALVKPFLSEETKNKVRILGGMYESTYR